MRTATLFSRCVTGRGRIVCLGQSIDDGGHWRMPLRLPAPMESENGGRHGELPLAAGRRKRLYAVLLRAGVSPDSIKHHYATDLHATAVLVLGDNHLFAIRRDFTAPVVMFPS